MQMFTFIYKNWRNLGKDTLAILASLWLFCEIMISLCKLDYNIPIWGICLVIFLIFILVSVCAYKTKEKKLQINHNNIYIKFGDIFRESGNKVIAFNEYFDTQVDEKIISSKTLNGYVVKNHIKNIVQFDNEIQNDSYLRPIKTNVSRTNGGKTNKYELGSCFRHDDIIAVAFTKFDKNDNARLTLNEYYCCLLNFWKDLNRVYNSENIVIPLLGSGITRIENGDKITSEEKLKILLHTLKYSTTSFSKDITITFVLNISDKNNIKLYNIDHDL